MEFQELGIPPCRSLTPEPDPNQDTTGYQTTSNYLPGPHVCNTLYCPLKSAEEGPVDDLPHPIAGVHISSEGGPYHLSGRLRDTFNNYSAAQFFAGSPRCAAPAHTYDSADIAHFVATVPQESLKHSVIHASHATNLASPDEEIAEAAFTSISNQMRECAELGVPTLCIHLGSALDCEDEVEVVDRVASRIHCLLEAVPDINLAMENMTRCCITGANDQSTWTLDLLHQIIQQLDDPRAMICLDLCHLYIAECNIFYAKERHRLFAQIEEIGGDRIAAIHVSDSHTPHGERVDGHIGGLIGLSALRHILRHPDFLGKIPYILETGLYSGVRETSTVTREIMRYEADRKQAEWALLERVILMTDAEWAAELAAQDAERDYTRDRRAIPCVPLTRPTRKSRWTRHKDWLAVPEANIRARIRGPDVSRATKGKFAKHRSKQTSNIRKVSAARRRRAGLSNGRKKVSVNKVSSPTANLAIDGHVSLNAAGYGIDKTGASWTSARTSAAPPPLTPVEPRRSKRVAATASNGPTSSRPAGVAHCMAREYTKTHAAKAQLFRAAKEQQKEEERAARSAWAARAQQAREARAAARRQQRADARRAASEAAAGPSARRSGGTDSRRQSWSESSSDSDW
ncbi:DNA-(apurinic or apyrimidinic site) lyase [Cryptotrichosporon argae]